jgi:ATP-dependent DNA helicase RecG
LANIVTDKNILEAARDSVANILENDYELNAPENQVIKNYLQLQKTKTQWSKIS